MGGRYQAKRTSNQSFSGVLDYEPKCNRLDMKPEELEATKATYKETFLNYNQAALQQIYEKTKKGNLPMNNGFMKEAKNHKYFFLLDNFLERIH